jgi:3-isopropylmalate/(R)-2-methylmalate dehydratase small subunit
VPLNKENNMKITGKVFKFGDDINTDEIIPARYLNTSDPEELAAHCMEDADPDFMKKKTEDAIIVGGDNFGCGSSREHAPISIKAAGVPCVIAKSFARIFYRNCINIGLPIFSCPEIVETLNNGDDLEIQVGKGEISKKGNKKVYTSEVFPGFIKQIISKGGLVGYAGKKRG